MNSPLGKGEHLEKDAPANLQKGSETLGGNLYLTNQRLIFEAHKFNLQGGVSEVKLSDIQSLRKVWTKVFGFIPVFPNSFAVRTKEGKELSYVVGGRSEWIARIDATRKS